LEDLAVNSPADRSFWRDRPVLVTGATGLLGGWLTRHLLAAEADVVCLVRDWVPRSLLLSEGLLDRIRTVRGDVTDQQCLERLLGEYEVSTVFHLAAQTIVPIANRNPISTFESNVRGTWGLLEAARRSPTVVQVVVASSDKAYGDQNALPYSEETPLQGRHPYDVSKSAADLIAQSYAKTYGSRIVIARCGNLYGGGDLNWNRVVPGTMRSVLRGERPVIRSDGRLVRDYVYVEDAAIFYMLMAEKLGADSALTGEAFNFSDENPLEVSAIVERILQVMDSDLEPVILNEASNEIRCQYLDSSKARKVLGWEAQFKMDEALARTANWYRSHFRMLA